MVKNEIQHICMVTSTHSPLDDRIFHKEALSLVQEGYQVTIIALSATHGESYWIKGVKIVPIKTESRVQRLVDLYYKGLKEAANVYHCHEVDALWAGLRIRNRIGTKVIYDCHEYTGELFSERFPCGLRPLARWAIARVERSLAGQSDEIITVNDVLRRRFSAYHPCVTVVPNYPELRPVSRGCNTRDNTRGGRTLIYVGALTGSMGVWEAVRAVAQVRRRFPDVCLICLGKFQDRRFQRAMMEYISHNDLADVVHFPGFIPHEQVYDHLSSVDAGMLLLAPLERHRQCEPIKLFEYMSAGLPVVANDYEMVRRIIAEHRCGLLVDPTDINQIADAIIYLFDHPEEAKEMGERGRRAVEEYYHWDEGKKRLLSVYDRIKRA